MTKNYYPIKVWLTTLICSSIIIGVATTIDTFPNFDSGIFELMIFMFLYSLVISIPTFAIYYWVFRRIKNGPMLRTKATLSAIAITGMLLSIFIIFGKSSYNLNGVFSGLTFSGLYIVTILAASFVFKIPRPHSMYHSVSCPAGGTFKQ